MLHFTKTFFFAFFPTEAPGLLWTLHAQTLGPKMYCDIPPVPCMNLLLILGGGGGGELPGDHFREMCCYDFDAPKILST